MHGSTVGSVRIVVLHPEGGPVPWVAPAPNDPPVLVSVLPSTLALPCEDGSWTVYLSYPSYLHICERRETSTPQMLELVLARLSTVIAAPTHVGNLSGDANKLDLFAWALGDAAGVLVCVKCLKGETWVSTAFPLGRKSLRKHLNAGRLRAVMDGA